MEMLFLYFFVMLVFKGIVLSWKKKMERNLSLRWKLNLKFSLNSLYHIKFYINSLNPLLRILEEEINLI